MVGSRHLFGTVLSRVENLLKSGALAKKPVWYDVVKAFPPLVETKINRRAEPGRAPKIVYPEDEFRNNTSRSFGAAQQLNIHLRHTLWKKRVCQSKFYNRFKTKEALSLFEGADNKPSPADRFVEKCQLLVAQGKDSEAAFDEAASLFKQGNLAQEKSTDEQKKEEVDSENLPDLLSLLTKQGKSSSHEVHTTKQLKKGELEDKPL